MELLHHFSTSTCYTISRLPVLQTVWRIRVPRFGFSYPYVLHCILALSALHLARLQPERHDHYVAQAELHHNRALQMVSSISTRKMLLLYTCFQLLHLSSIVRNHVYPTISGLLVAEILSGCRCSVAPGSLFWRQRKTSKQVSPIFENGKRRNLARNARSTAELTYLDDLRQLLRASVRDAGVLSCYLDAVNDMAKSFATIEEEGPCNCQTADVFIWLLQVSDDYLLLLRQRKPEALVIFSYFCVITHELEWAWWMQGLSIHLIRGIYYCLDEEHRCWLQCPMEQLGWAP